MAVLVGVLCRRDLRDHMFTLSPPFCSTLAAMDAFNTRFSTLATRCNLPRALPPPSQKSRQTPKTLAVSILCLYYSQISGFFRVFQGHLRGSAGQFRPFEAARWAITCHPERFQFQPIQASMNKAIELRPDRDMLRTFASRVLSSGQALQMSLTRQARHIADAGRFGYDS